MNISQSFRVIAYYFWIFLMGNSLLAQLPDLEIEAVSLKDGISDLRVNGILQDRQGFMWFGTWDRLNRYDGYEYKIYKHDPNDSTSIPSNLIEELFEDSRGNIWIASREGKYGLCRYNPAKDHFIPYDLRPQGDTSSFDNFSITSIGESSDGYLWFGCYTDKYFLVRMDLVNGALRYFYPDPEDPNSITNGFIFLIYEDAKKNLWIGTGADWMKSDGGGLNLYDPQTESFKRYQPDPTDPESLQQFPVMVALEDRRGNFWVGGGPDGLHLMNRETGVFKHFPANTENGNPSLIPPGSLYAIFEDPMGRLWFGGGARTPPPLAIFSPATENTQVFQQEQIAGIWEMVIDRSGVIWSGYGSNVGLYKIKLNTPIFEKVIGVSMNRKEDIRGTRMNEFARGIKNDFWIRTDLGLTLYEPAQNIQKQFISFDSPPGFGFSNHSIYQENDTVLWVGKAKELYKLDLAKLSKSSHTPYAVFETGVVYIFYSKSGELLVVDYPEFSRNHVLFRWSKDQKEFVPLGEKTLTNEGKAKYVRELWEDKRGQIWIAGEGLFSYDPDSGLFTEHSNKEILSALQLEDGNIWLGTRNQGLWYYDQTKKQFLQYNKAHGLIGNEIRSIARDKKGNLWLVTPTGISKFDTQALTFQNFLATETPLLKNQFNPFTMIKADDKGDLYFSTYDGLIRINTEIANQEKTVPQISLTQLVTAQDTLSLMYQTDTAITLSYEQNDLSIEYVGLHYVDPKSNTYSFFLENSDRNWVDAGTARQARYNGLDPGTYTFYVKARSSEGIWSEEEKLAITILSPWWATIWAYITYVLLGFGILYLIRYIELSRQKRKLQAQQRINAVTSKFVPNAFINSLGKKDIMEVQLGDVVAKETTVMFSDIRSYTTLSEKMTPEENFGFVIAFNRRMGPVIQQNGGFVNQYLGDSIMALFKDSPTDCLKAAIQMQQTLAIYNEERSAKGLSLIRIGIGFHTGPLMMGIIGDEKRMDAAIISDTVNTASRIESLTKHFKVNILLSEDSLEVIQQEVNEQFHFRFLGEVLLKGKNEPIGMYECFDGDSSEMLEKKLESQTLFVEAMKCYLSKQFADAVTLFEEVLAKHSADLTAQLFLDKAQNYLMHGVSDDWTGAEVMTFK